MKCIISMFSKQKIRLNKRNVLFNTSVILNVIKHLVLNHTVYLFAYFNINLKSNLIT